MKSRYFFCLLLFSFTKSYSQTSYACFENDKNKKLKLWVSFDKEDRAQYVKYAGQKDSIRLVYSRMEKSDNPGGIPAVYWSATYAEKFGNKITGEYIFTNAGTYQLDVTYKRVKDKKKFYFQIIDSTYDAINGVFQKTPCF